MNRVDLARISRDQTGRGGQRRSGTTGQHSAACSGEAWRAVGAIRRLVRRALFWLGLLILPLAGLMALLPHPALAHTKVLSLDPGPGDRLAHAPASVAVTFSEPVIVV